MIRYSDKLKKGDEIRVVAPSNSMSSVSKAHIELAKKELEDLGFIVTFGKNVYEMNDFNKSSSVQARVNDLHEAFIDKNVKMILPVIGGYHSNQLLSHLDWELIKSNPKIVGGYSDTTALQNAIFAKTRIVTYSSIAFIMMAKTKNNQYSLNSLLQCLTNNEEYEMAPCDKWDDSEWYINQENYELFDTTEFNTIQPGKAKGRVIGGNLGTFRLLQGTQYFPSLKEDYIYFLEECSPSKGVDFARELQSLIHASDLTKLKGIVIGRFQIDSQIDNVMLAKIIAEILELSNIPIISNAPFGHTYPIATFPIGGLVEIDANQKRIRILEH